MSRASANFNYSSRAGSYCMAFLWGDNMKEVDRFAGRYDATASHLDPSSPAFYLHQRSQRTERESLPAELDGQSVRSGESLCAERNQQSLQSLR